MHEANCWYFRTREGVEIGPYDTRFEAEIEVGLLKELLQKCEGIDECHAAVTEFILDGLAMGHHLNPMHRDDKLAVASN